MQARALFDPVTNDRYDAWLLIGSIAACAAVLAVKFWLIWRIDINWDEFYFLSHVYALVRGELIDVFQVTHAHLFRWLTVVPGDEMIQIVVARCVMFGLLIATAVLIWALARRWAATQAAVLAPLCYLATTAVSKHGGSFRTDSMVAPLSLAVLLLMTDRSRGRRALLAAAACFGISVAITLKALLLAPVLVAIAWLDDPQPQEDWAKRSRRAVMRLLEFGLVAACVGGAILAIHWLVLTQAVDHGPGEYAVAVMRKSLLDVELIPQRSTFEALFRQNLLSWLLILGGAVVALLRRRYVPLAFGLSLLPILFYRNTFSYYYLVMLAPASALAALAAAQLRSSLGDLFGRVTAGRILLVIASALVLQAAIHLFALREDHQVPQRAVISAVHRVFPSPVPYVDHSGMIASFRKVNFFMSTWGIQAYRARGRSFMREAIDRYRPPLLLANRAILDPDSESFRSLLPEDRRLIETSYVRHWGPIWIAGTEALMTGDRAVAMRVPFPGRYRLQTNQAVVIDGTLYHDRQEVDLTQGEGEVLVHPTQGASAEAKVRLIWAAAKSPPSWPPPSMPLYTGL